MRLYMAILGKPEGIFDLNNSDVSVGSYLLKNDVKEILNVNENDLKNVPFVEKDNNTIIDERNIQKLWYSNKIPNASPINKSSLDELMLIAIIRKTNPEINIERQIKIGHYSMDLKLTLNKKPFFIEFDGPYHFIMSRYGEPKNPLIKKENVQKKDWN
jgi:hypothetical protein